MIPVLQGHWLLVTVGVQLCRRELGLHWALSRRDRVRMWEPLALGWEISPR